MVDQSPKDNSSDNDHVGTFEELLAANLPPGTKFPVTLPPTKNETDEWPEIIMPGDWPFISV